MKVSIVITNYNGQKLLQKNLPNVTEASSNYEIIIVDDCSTDNSVDFLSKNYPQIKIIKNQKNLKFGQSSNIGVRAAQGDYVILLNSDVSPKKDFITPLLKHFNDPKVFSIGCKEIEEKNGKEFISGRTEAQFKRGFLVHWKPKDQESLNTFWTFGGSMAVDKQKFLALSGFDPIYSPAYWEDIDLCFRAKLKGWQCLFEKNSIVYHNHESTNQKVFGNKKIEEIAFRNQILFIWKNIRGKKLLEHFLWLPYHLLFTSIKTRGVFLKSFIDAIFRHISFL